MIDCCPCHFLLCALTCTAAKEQASLDSSVVLKKTEQSIEAYCLLLPGKSLNLSELLHAKKFRGRGNKDGALLAFRQLETAGLGYLEEVSTSSANHVRSN